MSDGGSSSSITAIAVNSVASNNSGTGFRLGSSTSDTSYMLVRSVVAKNGTGAFVTAGTLRLGESKLTGNTASWTVGLPAGTLASFADNYIDGNGDGDPAPSTIIAKKLRMALLKGK